MSALISRQDAIDALGEEPFVWDENDDYDVATRNQWRYDVECIKEVPSIQSEQTKMIKEIRKWINSRNRGSADYFIVDKIEEIINKYE